MLTHKPVNRYLASKDAQSSEAAAPDGASPRRLRTPPRSVASTIRLSCRLFVDATEHVLHRSTVALSKNNSMAELFGRKSSAILNFSSDEILS